MKKIFFLATFAILLAAGCQKTEVLNQAVGDPMTFSTGMAKLTKSATASGEENLKTQGFYVWAYAAYTDKLNDVNLGDVHEGIEGIKVTYDGTNCSTGDTDYYWPGTGLNLDFFAISTIGQVNADTTASVAFNGQGTDKTRSMILTNYTVNHQTPGDDLMVAEFVRQNQGMNNKAVSLHFHHALSKVRFKFVTTKDDNTVETVTVKSLTVGDDGNSETEDVKVKTKGTLTVNETAELADSDKGRKKIELTWSEQSDPQPFSVTKEAVLGTETDWTKTYTSMGEEAYYATWLVLPQDISGLNVTIAYTIEGGKKTITDSRTFALTRAGGEGVEAFNNWGTNKVTTYTINISPNKISFTPSVQPWDDEEEYTDQN